MRGMLFPVLILCGCFLLLSTLFLPPLCWTAARQMGNYNMEPPGLFRGRGEHPRTGALKKVRVCVCVCVYL